MAMTSIAKRFKITKKGKIFHKRCGQDHLRAKKKGKAIRAKRKEKEIAVFKKILRSSL